MDGNILSGGVEELQTINKNLLELYGYRDNNDLLSSEESKLEKNINSKEKVIADEIVSTTKKRKEEIEGTYNSEIDKTHSRIKKIRNKKKKSKKAKIAERIESETAGLREEHRQLVLETKSIFKQNQVPSFCNTKGFYSLFMPKGFGDFIIICLALILILLAIPCAIYIYVLPEKEMIYLVLIYSITVIFFGGIYMLIDNNVKDKNKESLAKVRVIRRNMNENKKKINQIEKSIQKDRDESTYELDNFNKELQELENEMNVILEQKKEALTIFENTTRFVIGEEIKAQNEEELNGLKKEYARVNSELKKNEGKLKILSMEISTQYEAYLGKEFMSTEKINQLAELMTNHNLTTISEAIARYKQDC